MLQWGVNCATCNCFGLIAQELFDILSPPFGSVSQLAELTGHVPY